MYICTFFPSNVSTCGCFDSMFLYEWFFHSYIHTTTYSPVGKVSFGTKSWCVIFHPLWCWVTRVCTHNTTSYSENFNTKTKSETEMQKSILSGRNKVNYFQRIINLSWIFSLFSNFWLYNCMFPSWNFFGRDFKVKFH